VGIVLEKIMFPNTGGVLTAISCQLCADFLRGEAQRTFQVFRIRQAAEDEYSVRQIRWYSLSCVRQPIIMAIKVD